MKKVHLETEKILLKNEDDCLKDLKDAYVRSLVKVKKKVQELLEEIEYMEDMDANESLIRSREYQLNYQKALEAEINEAMKILADSEVKTVDDFLKKMYEDGYITQQYVINQLGIPILTPLNAKKLTEAVYMDVAGLKFSERLKQNIDTLAEATKQSIAHGIIQGKSYASIAEQISLHSEASMKRAYTIARTEGGRVSSLAKVQSQMDAKKRGADIVKRWSSHLDMKTRPAHKELDGQVREIDEYFEVDGYKAKAPRLFEVAYLDINCRCISQTLPRWDVPEYRYKRDGLVTEKDLKEAYNKAKEEGRLEEYLNSPEGIAGELRQVKNYTDWKERYVDKVKEE